MTEKLPALLRESLQDVLEKMFFIRSIGDGDISSEDAKEPVAIRVDFEGAESGTLLLQVTPNAARSISADFLGTEECELADQQVAEVMSELANMICGSVLSRVDTISTFRIGAPHVYAMANRPLTTTRSVEQSFDIAGGRLTILLTTEVPLC